MERDSYNSSNSGKRAFSMRTSRNNLGFFAKVFVTTFFIIFIVIVVAIVKFTSRINLDEPKDNQEAPIQDISGYSDNSEEQKTIDKRLILLQQEENAPNEAKIIGEKSKETEIIDPKHIEDVKRYERMEKLDSEKSETKKESNTIEKSRANSNHQNQSLNNQEHNIKNLKPYIKNDSYENNNSNNNNNNVTIMSKVLAGKFQTFEEAQKLQREIKETNPASVPYVKKVGEVYTVQMGSYADFSVAKSQASALKARGLDVWIYQQ